MRFAEIVNKLNKEVNAALDDPKMKARLAAAHQRVTQISDLGLAARRFRRRSSDRLHGQLGLNLSARASDGRFRRRTMRNWRDVPNGG
jgi:hypothetical protein